MVSLTATESKNASIWSLIDTSDPTIPAVNVFLSKMLCMQSLSGFNSVCVCVCVCVCACVCERARTIQATCHKCQNVC